jgi:hypothetical protein
VILHGKPQFHRTSDRRFAVPLEALEVGEGEGIGLLEKGVGMHPA